MRATIVYLDQNMWIDLARALKTPEKYPYNREILDILREKTGCGAMRIPLTSSNLYETHKINNPELRAAVALVQIELSQADVFRSRRRRLKIEISRVLAGRYDLTWTEPPSDWVFSRVFFEAFVEFDDPRLDLRPPDMVIEIVRNNPKLALFDYLVEIDDSARRQAVSNFEKGCDRLRGDIEERRERHRNESLSLRRKIYSALLVLEDQEILGDVADKLGLSRSCFQEDNGATMRSVVNETPAFFIERELALKLEGQARSIQANDIRDMQNFSTVLPYVDVVVAEKQFTDLARQADLASRFRVRLETNLEILRHL